MAFKTSCPSTAKSELQTIIAPKAFLSGHSNLRAFSNHRSCCTSSSNRISLQINARYRGYNTDLSKVGQFERFEGDVGSTEVQIARFSARVDQLTTHLKQNKKDFACERGLKIILGKRRRALNYLYSHDKDKCMDVVGKLGIRYRPPVKTRN